jgi:hypothetical protein
VTTCNGGVAAQACNLGAEISADATSSGYGNAFTSPNTCTSTGTAFKVDNANGSYNLSISGLRGASFSNTNSVQLRGNARLPCQWLWRSWRRSATSTALQPSGRGSQRHDYHHHHQRTGWRLPACQGWGGNLQDDDRAGIDGHPDGNG